MTCLHMYTSKIIYIYKSYRRLVGLRTIHTLLLYDIIGCMWVSGGLVRDVLSSIGECVECMTDRMDYNIVKIKWDIMQIVGSYR